MEYLSEMLGYIMLQIQFKLGNFFKKEDGAVDIIAMVVLIAIAILLAVLFRDQIGALVERLFGAINGNVDDAIKKF